MGSYHPISRVAVIGAGPTGTACAKYLVAERAFEQIDVFEQRDRVGGVWNLSSTDRTRKIPVPQEDPFYGSHHASGKAHETTNGNMSRKDINSDSLEFESPLYDYLETNIPKKLMEYSDYPLPDHYQLFPGHRDILEYLERYADEVRHLIKFGTQVQDVHLVERADLTGRDRWELTSRNLATGTVSTATYDAIVVASGHYTIPHVVDIKGLANWNKAYPGVILHSKAYRKPEAFEGQRVLIIGNSASGTDLAAQISPFSSHVYLSSKSASIFGVGAHSRQEDIDEVVEFLPASEHQRAVRTKSGKIIDNLDTVLFATGYLYSYPFLASLDPPIVTDGLRTRDIYQHFLHIVYPTLAFPVVNLKVIPFGLAQNQAAVIARIWSGRLPTPSADEMRDWEKEKIAQNGDGKHFHLMKFPEDAAQMNDLYEWAAAASPSSLLENNGNGKMGLAWDERRVWTRSKFPEIKKAFAERGSARCHVLNVEELGFDYDSWRKNAPPDVGEMFAKARCPS